MKRYAVVSIWVVLILCAVLPYMKQRAELRHESHVMSEAEKESFQAQKVHPSLNLYLGSYPASLQHTHLMEKNITHIVSVILAVASPPYTSSFRTSFNYIIVKGLDRPNQELIDHFEDVHQFIDNALKDGGGGVLVHCMAGVSRSATIVISYLMKELNMSYMDAKNHVKSVRHIISPNGGFVEQLKHYEQHLQAKSKKQKIEDVFVPPLSAYGLSEQKGLTLLQTVILNCPKQQECVYMKGYYVVDVVQDMAIYVTAQLYRIEDKISNFLAKKLSY